MPAEEIRRRVEEAADILGLTGELQRKLAQLSEASASAWRWVARSFATRARS